MQRGLLEPYATCLAFKLRVLHSLPGENKHIGSVKTPNPNRKVPQQKLGAWLHKYVTRELYCGEKCAACHSHDFMQHNSVGKKKNDFLQQAANCWISTSVSCVIIQLLRQIERGQYFTWPRVIHRVRLTSLVNKRGKKIPAKNQPIDQGLFPTAPSGQVRTVPGSPLVGHVDARVLAGRLHVDRSAVLQLLLLVVRRRRVLVVRRRGLMLPAHLEPLILQPACVCSTSALDWAKLVVFRPAAAKSIKRTQHIDQMQHTHRYMHNIAEEIDGEQYTDRECVVLQSK